MPLTPIITVVGGTFAAYLGGAVVTETVFAEAGYRQACRCHQCQGITRLFREQPYFLAVFMILVILVTDILYGIFDPRIRVQDS